MRSVALQLCGLRQQSCAAMPPMRHSPLVLALCAAAFCIVWLARAAQPQYVPSPTSLRLHGPLPFGNFAWRARGFASVEALLSLGTETLLLCHPFWHGIHEASMNIGAPVLEVPGVVNYAHLSQLVDALAAVPRLRALVVQGVPAGTLELARALTIKAPAVRVYVIFHGAPSNLYHVISGESAIVDSLLNAADNGVVFKMGWVKAGLAPLFEGMAGVHMSTVWNFPALPLSLPMPILSYGATGDIEKSMRHVGVLANGLVTKNVLTQVLAACMLPGVTVHVLDSPGAEYIYRCNAPVIVHGFLEHTAFTRLLGSMDVNLYVSLSECMPMVVLESAALGVPCITSSTSAVYTADADLERELIVTNFDNPSAIQAQLLHVLAHRDALGRRLAVLLDSMHEMATEEWQRFLDLEGDLGGVGATLDRYNLPIMRPVTITDWRSTISPLTAYALEEESSRAKLQLEEDLSPSLATFHVAFITYELAPLTAGGAGVVIAALAVELLARGYRVTLLVHMPCEDARSWEEYARQQVSASKSGHGSVSSERLRVLCIPELIYDISATRFGQEASNLFLQRSREFALAAREAYAQRPFDVLEVFDYAGVAFELLRARRNESIDDCDYEGAFGGPLMLTRDEYLPRHVPVVVRAHGSLQIIDQVEAEIAKDESDVPPQTALMYRMEQYCLASADFVLAQSKELAVYYTKAYGLRPPGRILVAPPPIARILAQVDNVEEVGTFGTGDPTIFVYGKLQRIKGTETVAAAVAQLALLSPTVPFRLEFVGLDMPCPEHKRPLSICVRNALPRALASRTIFRPPLKRNDLPRHILDLRRRGPVIAVFASVFETFGIAAHEVAALGVPLVLSDIAAFDFWADLPYVRRFRAGNASDLASALHMMLNGELTTVTPKLFGGDALLPYQRILSGGVLRDNKAQPSRLLVASVRLACSRAHDAP